MMDIILSDERSVSDLQRERTILEVIRAMIWSKDESGKNYTITRACNEAGISYSTWKLWVQEGLVAGPLHQVASEFNQNVYNQILPHYENMVAGLVALALGQRPEGSHIVEVRPSDMIAAFRELSKIIPIQPMDQAAGTKKSELEHLDDFQPAQIMVVQGDFIYQGQSSARLGELPSIANSQEEDDYDSIEDLSPGRS